MKIKSSDIYLFIILLVIFSLIENGIADVIIPTILITFFIKYFFLDKSTKVTKNITKTTYNKVLDIEEKIQQKRLIANEKNIPNLLTNLYFDKIQYYPSWQKRKESKKYIPNIITKISGEENILIEFNENTYKFKFTKIDTPYYIDDVIGAGILELVYNNKKVFVLEVHNISSSYDSYWTSNEINGFIDGSWVNNIKELYKITEKLSKTNYKEFQDKNKEEKINKIKGDFDL